MEKEEEFYHEPTRTNTKREREDLTQRRRGAEDAKLLFEKTS
jgi:hypothetical protein